MLRRWNGVDDGQISPTHPCALLWRVILTPNHLHTEPRVQVAQYFLSPLPFMGKGAPKGLLNHFRLPPREPFRFAFLSKPSY